MRLEADVVIVGTGAGGGTAAEILSAAGLKVVMVESGALLSSSDFHMLEREAYPLMYQESGNRQTKDKGITISQGRTGGRILTTGEFDQQFPHAGRHRRLAWRDRFGWPNYTPEARAPWFALVAKRLNIAPWAAPPNENNAILKRGAAKIGIETAVVPRNVKGCWNLGYCGLGRPDECEAVDAPVFPRRSRRRLKAARRC